MYYKLGNYMRLGISSLLFNLDEALELCKDIKRIEHIEVGIDNLDECLKLCSYKDKFNKLNLSLGIHLPMELNSCENIKYIRNSWVDFINKMEYELKDLNIKYFNNNSDMTFWKNLDTNEDLIFYNSNEKIYSNSNGGMIERLPIGITFTENIGTRILMSINPTLYIGSKEYNGINCYYIKQFNYEEFIEKETGLILYSNYDNDIRKIS